MDKPQFGFWLLSIISGWLDYGMLGLRTYADFDLCETTCGQLGWD